MASTIKVDKIAQSSGTPEFTIPTVDGTAGQFLKTDGSGVLAFDTVTTNPLSLTGSTNTWIPTITAANALTGTANFTYDGTTLGVKNSGTASDVKVYCESANSHYTSIKSAAHAAYTGGSWTMTLPGTDGAADEFLQTDGAGATTWAEAAGGSLVFLTKQTLPTTGSAAYIEFLECFSSTYRNYAILFDNIHASTDGELYIITGDSTMSGTLTSWTWGQTRYSGVSGHGNYYSNSDNGGGRFATEQKGGGSNCEGASGIILMHSPQISDVATRISGNCFYFDETGGGNSRASWSIYGGICLSEQVDVSFRIQSSGNIESENGTISVFGYKES